MHFEEVAYGTLKAFDICQAQPVRVGRTMCSLKHEGEGKTNKREKKKRERKHGASGFQRFLQKQQQAEVTDPSQGLLNTLEVTPFPATQSLSRQGTQRKGWKGE